MNTFTIQPLLDWIALNPTWSGWLILIIAAAESLLIVGILVPGALLMLGVGALVASGTLELWSTLMWATMGAIMGDGISFWLGRYFNQRLRTLWPFRRFPLLLERGEAFFTRHGGKSIIIGRFVGPVRAVVPAVAGMLGMSVQRFTLVNIISAILWAPSYILPGVVLGASLGLATEVGSRLAVLLVVVLVLLWLTVWLVRRTFLFLQPRTHAMISSLMQWGRSHAIMGPVVSALVDPQEAELRGLSIVAAVLVAAAWAFLVGAQALLNIDPFARMDSVVLHLMQGLRTPWADRLMGLFASLGSAQVNASVATGVLLWLVVKRAWLASAHWLAAISFGILLALVLCGSQSTSSASFGNAEFPLMLQVGAHVTIAVTIYGFLAVLLARELVPPRRWLAYAGAGLMISAITLSQLYLGIYRLSSTLSGLGLALAWIVLLGIAYRRHILTSVSITGLSIITAASLVVATNWYYSQYYLSDMQRFAPRPVMRHLDQSLWWQQAWRQLPSYRIDLEGELEQPMTIQWAGRLDDLARHLLSQGWQAPPSLQLSHALLWLAPDQELSQLPILPHVHDGRHEGMLLVSRHTSGDRQLLLRLWPADIILGKDGPILWEGYASHQYLDHPLPILSIPRTHTDIDTAMDELLPFVQGLIHKTVRRNSKEMVGAKPQLKWNGEVVLLRAPTSPSEGPL